MELRKKMRAKDFAMTHGNSQRLDDLRGLLPGRAAAEVLSGYNDIARLDLSRKLRAERGLKPYCFISSMVFNARYSVGMMMSVSMSSPRTQTFPVIFSM